MKDYKDMTHDELVAELTNIAEWLYKDSHSEEIEQEVFKRGDKIKISLSSGDDEIYLLCTAWLAHKEQIILVCIESKDTFITRVGRTWLNESDADDSCVFTPNDDGMITRTQLEEKVATNFVRI